MANIRFLDQVPVGVYNSNSGTTRSEVKHDFNEPYDYIGKAPVGSSVTTPVWFITRITVFSNGSTLSETADNVNWTGRYTHTYT